MAGELSSSNCPFFTLKIKIIKNTNPKKILDIIIKKSILIIFSYIKHITM